MIERVVEAAPLAERVASWRREGRRVGFVPTMGALHEGHLSLVRLARARADRVVASVFVNPTQFDDRRDLAAYPRDPAGDAEKLASAGCDLVFEPTVEVIYPPGDSTVVEVRGPSRGFEGDQRPGHFRGVATVVTKLFGLVRPDLAVFGEKDAQQLAVVQCLVRDLHLPVEIVPGEVIRESDGLAMSSRNVRLGPEARGRAAGISGQLFAIRDRLRAGDRDLDELRMSLQSRLACLFELDYADFVDPESFEPLERLAPGARVVIPVAVRLDGVRLLDNVRLELPA